MILSPKDKKINWFGLILNLLIVVILGLVLFGWFNE
jgi:hypothetical protein